MPKASRDKPEQQKPCRDNRKPMWMKSRTNNRSSGHEMPYVDSSKSKHAGDLKGVSNSKCTKSKTNSTRSSQVIPYTSKEEPVQAKLLGKGELSVQVKSNTNGKGSGQAIPNISKENPRHIRLLSDKPGPTQA